MFSIHMGIPEMERFWNELIARVDSNNASKNEEKLLLKLGKVMKQLANNPKYPGLKSHEIKALTNRYGQRVFESYLDNKKPAAGRIFWVYGPGKDEITVIGLEPYPDDKARSYERIVLSEVDGKLSK